MPTIPQPNIDNLDPGSYHQTEIQHHKIRSATHADHSTIADRINELEATQTSRLKKLTQKHT